jgi:hypothetical protein
VEEFLKQETTEAAQKFLASKGVEITVEQLEEIQKTIAAKSNSEEMNDEDLEKVAGGASGGSFAQRIADIIKKNQPILVDPPIIKPIHPGNKPW